MKMYYLMWTILIWGAIACFLALGLGVLIDKNKQRDRDNDNRL